MQCNSSGWSSTDRAKDFGIVSYDWSNAKREWAVQKPMDCEERLLKQAEMTKNVSKQTHVFVYRNLVKALPWFASVREKLLDPRYGDWFVRFNGNGNYTVPACAAENSSKCSAFYHDQEQTPEVPTSKNPSPDGSCDGECDCGEGLPCGEYIFDHRNGTMLRNWIVEEMFLSPFGLGSDAIDGFFTDDYWCSNLICEETENRTAGCPCNDPTQGPTEIDKHFQDDTGLSDEDIRDMTIAWNATMHAVERAILQRGGYSWWLMKNQQNANAMPIMLSATNATECTRVMRDACTIGASTHEQPTLYGMSVKNGTILARPVFDLAFFLLARGPYAWIGYGIWGMTWPFNPEPAHGELPPLPHGVPFPDILRVDHGEPIDRYCSETSEGVFERRWTNAHVNLDCTTGHANITTAHE